MKFRRGALALTVALTTAACSNLFGVFATGKVAKDIITDATSAGDALIHSARTAGDALSAKLGNELTVAAQNATFLAGAEIDKRLSRLSTENRLVLERLDKLTQSLKDTKTTTLMLLRRARFREDCHGTLSSIPGLR